MTPEQKYRRALHVMESITANHSFESIQHNLRNYRRTQNPNLRHFYNLYYKYMNNKKIIENYESQNHIAKCENCQRCQVHPNIIDNGIYSISFINQENTYLKRRKFKHLRSSSRNVETYSLCIQCNLYLTSDRDGISSDMAVVWPSYIGYVYMLISVRDKCFNYIVNTMSIRRRIQQHNSGVGSVSTEPIHLRPYALLAYITGFNARRNLLFYIEAKWKQNLDKLVRQGVNDVRAWARCGSEIISNINEEYFGISPMDLTLVCLFNE